ncbi:MAG: PglZ domain-containing protein [bacterium]|nr:PglZ domain-containing protein [bacterium]
MTTLRAALTKQLAQKVQRYGLVIWEDRGGEYKDVASSVAPEDVLFEPFNGSWYDLRRRVESAVSGDRPPRLVVYTPAPIKDDDPLAEVRDAAGKFTRRLSTLVRQSLRGTLSPARITAISEQARTLREAEMAAEGPGETDVRLTRVMGTLTPLELLVNVLTGASDDDLSNAGLWDAVVAMANQTVGADVAGVSDELRHDIFQHLLLADISRVIGGPLPDTLQTASSSLSASQRRSTQDLLERLRGATGGLAAHRRLATAADTRLALADSLQWRPGLEDAVGTPALEKVLLGRSIRFIQETDYGKALEIAERRLEVSPWVSDPNSGWGGRWRTVQAISRLHAELAKANPPLEVGPCEMLAWYVEQGWLVDRAHRRLELARSELRRFGDLEDTLNAARIAYETWLDHLLDRFVSSVTDKALETDGLIRQGEVHDRFVAEGQGRTAYVWVDALRYELGMELADALGHITKNVTIHAAVAAAPTITQVGMANLLPGAASDLGLELEGNRLRVSIGGTRVNSVRQRRELLRARHGSVADLDLNDASQKGEKALGNAIEGADLILVRSQEVDSAGESGLLSVAWSHFQTVIGLLANVIARLAQCGVERVIISADHGFIALSQSLGAQRTVDPPAGGVGITKRRVFVGRGANPRQATARVPIASCGIPGDLDLIVPRGLAVFRAGGARQFFHGGLSPQELIVPVIVVESRRAPEPQKLKVGITVAGGRITTGIFAATISFDGDLFTNEVRVRVFAGSGGGPPVARVVSGDGYDPDTGTVTVGTGRSSVLTFLVIENLGANTEVNLQVLDARTGLKLASATAPVASPVVVEDELD